MTRIVRDSVLDGPGCRYVVFVKGCHLTCPWCHNPETQKGEQQLIFYEKQCIKCGLCLEEVSKRGPSILSPHSLGGSIKEADLKLADICPSNALSLSSKSYDIDWLIEDMCKYKTIYQGTDGGLTISGGEPLLCSEFSIKLLKRAKKKGLNTAIDTSAAIEWEIIEKFLAHTDLWLVDFKHPNDDQLMSDLVKENIKKLISAKASLWIRIPVIPQCNDSDEISIEMAKFLMPLMDHIERIDLLRYHPYGKVKYVGLSMEYNMDENDEVEVNFDGVYKNFIENISEAKVHKGKNIVSS